MLSCLPTIPDAGGLVKAAAAVQPVYLPMERDYEGDETRALAMELAAYQSSSRKNPSGYGKQLYKQRNQAERLSAVSNPLQFTKAPCKTGSTLL